MQRADWHGERVDILCFGNCRLVHKFCPAIGLVSAKLRGGITDFDAKNRPFAECPHDFNAGAFLGLNALNHSRTVRPTNLNVFIRDDV